MDLKNYRVEGFFDELTGPSGRPRVASRALWKYLRSLDAEELVRKASTARCHST